MTQPWKFLDAPLGSTIASTASILLVILVCSGIAYSWRGVWQSSRKPRKLPV